MKKLHFPEPFQREHPRIQDVNKVFEEQLTLGQRASDDAAPNPFPSAPAP
jgi:hypothetical protein